MAGVARPFFYLNTKTYQNMDERYQAICQSFEKQCKLVLELTNFDKDFISIIINILEESDLALLRNNIENEALRPKKALVLLKNLRDQGPQQKKYAPIYNQSIVLLVSYFSSAVSDIFNDSLTYLLTSTESTPNAVFKERIDLSISELSSLNFDISKDIGRIVARKSDISFQDMQSIYRAFKKFFDLEMEWNQDVDNIITAQALRHVIVHSAEITDEKCVNQLRSARNRSLKPDVKPGIVVTFSKEEIETTAISMKNYISKLCKKLQDKHPLLKR
jgi:hypothetical protein